MSSSPKKVSRRTLIGAAGGATAVLAHTTSLLISV
jgi:hypothetical protein